MDCVTAQEPIVVGSIVESIVDTIVRDAGPASAKRLKRTEPIAVDWTNLSIRQPVNGDSVIQVRHRRPHGSIEFYLDGLHKDAPLAATAFAASHFGPFDNEPPHLAAQLRDEIIAVVTKLLRAIKTVETVAPHYRCLTQILAGACLNSHAPMAFDPHDLAAKLRLIADGHAREYVSYTALCCS